MAVALPAQTAEGVSAAVATLRGLPGVNPGAIYLFGVDEAACQRWTPPPLPACAA